MKNIILLLLLCLLTFVSCKNDTTQHESNSKEVDNLKSYFYPSDSLFPTIYAYKNSINPLEEKFHRFYKQENEKDTGLVLEFYNSKLMITEAFTLSLNSFEVMDHMIVDGDGKKRKAKVSEKQFFPINEDVKTSFTSDFPSHLDSITLIYQSKKHVYDSIFKMSFLDTIAPTILVKDSVRYIFANTTTKEVGSQTSVINRYYAKGYGLVRWTSEDGKNVYEISSILNNQFWTQLQQQ
ncbi:hypothetical protein CW751_10735 [Brumimicrobium salinarum]|uniref:Lipoprotein n=1 Tax=Brumimicrobium salinarum TaxID=2058658 RepID=A0A2I0R172_9FLAO|nr:hypothetical protein [Brumimicrobium salinarum]PKR80319.1 hypothetical protein CW751_10735 [Brumimicrobium salinarum]